MRLSFGFSGVHLFFVLSGFIIAFIHHGDVSQPRRLPGYAYKRFARIYPIYWIVLALYLPFHLSGLAGGINWYHLLDNLTLLRISNHDKILAVAWTLSHEILFYGVFALLILHRGIGALLMSTWLLLIGYNVATGATLQPPWRIAEWTHIDYGAFTNFTALASNPINLLFFLGMLSYLLYAWFKDSAHAERIAGVSLGIGLAIFTGTGIYWVHTTTTHIGWEATNLYFGMASFCLLLVILSRKADAWAARRSFLVLAGNASYSIYLLHYGCQEILIRLFGEQPPANPALLFVVLTILPTALGIACHVKIEAPILRSMRRRAPERKA